jgi:hypothetical protein
MSYLSYDNPVFMGNNPYLQSRTKVDPRYRMIGGKPQNLSQFKGYSATGDLLKQGQAGISDYQQMQLEHADRKWQQIRRPNSSQILAYNIPSGSTCHFGNDIRPPSLYSKQKKAGQHRRPKSTRGSKGTRKAKRS